MYVPAYRPPDSSGRYRVTSGADRALAAATAGVTWGLLAVLAAILTLTFWRGRPALALEFLTAPPHQGMTSGSIYLAMVGTVALIVLMMVAVVPIGTMTAIFLHEYDRRGSWLARAAGQAVDGLAGVPSVVFGMFGLAFFVRGLGQAIDRTWFGGSLTYGQPALIWAAMTLAVATLPVMVLTSLEALRNVPDALREASLALGATRWQTLRRVVLPRALPGILGGSILTVSRGAGEVAPIMFTGAAYFLPYVPQQLNDQFMELGHHAFILATQSPDVRATESLLFGVTLVLLGVTFVLNLTAIWLRSAHRNPFARWRRRLV